MQKEMESLASKIEHCSFLLAVLIMCLQVKERGNVFFFFLPLWQVNEDERAELEEQTRGQGDNAKWHAEHCGRITASCIHRVVVRRAATEPDKLVADIMKYKKKKPLRSHDPRSHGHTMEPEARRAYEDLHSCSELSVTECGMFVDPELGFLGASPDGIVKEESSHSRGVLEIKCPMSALPIETLPSQDKNFCLAFSDSGMCLKKSHAYYSQVQMQMAVTGCTWADFFVYTRTDDGPSFFLERISFDKEFWAIARQKAELFYKNYVVLELLTKRVQRSVKLVPTS